MMKTLKPILFVIIFFSLISAACLVSGTTENPPATEAVEPVTQEVIVVTATQAVVPPTAEPTEEIVQPTIEEPVSQESPAYFTEEFEGDTDDWSWFLTSGNENDMDLYTEDGYLVFDLNGEEQYVYVVYDPYTYSDVGIEVRAENRGMNTNNVSLICNYSDRYGWYEFSITNGGMFYIYAYSEIDGGYYLLGSGGSTNVVMGRGVNTYAATCDGNDLTLYINGVREYELTDNKYNLNEGQVGFGVSSFDVLPIIVDVDYVTIY